MIKKILLISLLFVPLVVGAEGTADKQTPQAEYLFHLYYDNGQLNADRDFQFKYDIISEEFVQESLTTQFPYRGEIINMLGEIANHFVFDPKNGDIHFVQGKISVKAPYVADGEKAVFYDAQNQPLLTIFINDSSFCNDDGICNADRGEDSLSCPKDCKQTLPAPPVNTPTTSTTGSSGIIYGIIYAIIGIVLLVGLWWVFKRRRSGQAPTLSGLPPPTLPTPSTPPSPDNPI